jgi:ankyrin repeat protein
MKLCLKMYLVIFTCLCVQGLDAAHLLLEAAAENDVTALLNFEDADVLAICDDEGNTAFLAAALAGSLNFLGDVANVLEQHIEELEQGVHFLDAQRNKYGETALMRAAGADQVECVQFLLNLGASPLCTDLQGNTALFHAAFSGSIDCMQPLIDAVKAQSGELPPDTNFLDVQVNSRGETALMCAVKADRATCAQVLLDLDASSAHRDLEGHSVLRWAAMSNCVASLSVLIEYLKEHCVVKDMINRLSRALLYAVEEQAQEAVVMLLSAGADPEHPDKKGRTPLGIARRIGQDDPIYLILLDFVSRSPQGKSPAPTLLRSGSLRELDYPSRQRLSSVTYDRDSLPGLPPALPSRSRLTSVDGSPEVAELTRVVSRLSVRLDQDSAEHKELLRQLAQGQQTITDGQDKLFALQLPM